MNMLAGTCCIKRIVDDSGTEILSVYIPMTHEKLFDGNDDC